MTAAEEAFKDAAKAMVAATGPKLPAFWPEEAEVWFVQAEAQFTLRNITTDDTKYAHLVSTLDNRTAARVLDYLRNPTAGGKYDGLKTRLINAFKMTVAESSDRILDCNGLGDSKPSALLDQLLALVPTGQDPGFLFRQVFLRQLPSDVRALLAQSTKTGFAVTDLRALALEADNYYLSTGVKIASATKQPSLPAKSQPIGLCWCHARFGKEARRCIPPCSFKAPGNGGAGRQ